MARVIQPAGGILRTDSLDSLSLRIHGPGQAGLSLSDAEARLHLPWHASHSNQKNLLLQP